jgi:uncharacterized iron-regulated protein
MSPFTRLLGPAVAGFSLLLGLAGLSQVPALAAPNHPYGLERPTDGSRVAFHKAVDELAQADIVLVGEHHNHPGDHRAQAQLIQGLLARTPVVVGLEALPRDANPALERWRRGEFSNFPTFLAASGWYRHWGLSADLYRPILETARLNGLPLVGMNIPRRWVRQVASQGISSLPDSARQAIGEVAPPTPAYRQYLKEHFRAHRQGQGGRQTTSGELSGFAAAQAVWDAAMAQALIRAQREHPGAVVVGVVGSGHLRQGLGIQRQIAARDEGQTVATVLPYAAGEPAQRPGPEGLDFAWALPGEPAPASARLGVAINRQDEGEGLLVRKVVPGSSAERAGLEAGDRLLAVDGREVRRFTDLVHAVKGHHWGQCLRVRLRRGGAERTLSVPLSPSEDAQARGSHGSR